MVGGEVLAGCAASLLGFICGRWILGMEMLYLYKVGKSSSSVILIRDN